MAAAMRTIFQAADERRDVMQPLIDLARRTGWLAFHPYRSNRSAPGFPDLVLLRAPGQSSTQYGPPYLIFAECKRETGRLSPAQRAWGTALSCVQVLTDGAIRYAVVRPSTRHVLEELLVASAGRAAARGAGARLAPRVEREVVR